MAKISIKEQLKMMQNEEAQEGEQEAGTPEPNKKLKRTKVARP